MPWARHIGVLVMILALTGTPTLLMECVWLCAGGGALHSSHQATTDAQDTQHPAAQNTVHDHGAMAHEAGPVAAAARTSSPVLMWGALTAGHDCCRDVLTSVLAAVTDGGVDAKVVGALAAAPVSPIVTVHYASTERGTSTRFIAAGPPLSLLVLRI